MDLLAPVLYILIKDKKLIWILFIVQAVYLIYKGPDILHSRFIYILYTWVGAKTQYAYSFWLFAIHFYLDIIVGRYLSSRLPVLISQISSWVIVVCVGLASGVLVHRFLPYFFMVFAGKRKKRE